MSDITERLQELTDDIDDLTDDLDTVQRHADEWKSRAKLMAERATKAEAAQHQIADRIRDLVRESVGYGHMTATPARAFIQLADDIDKDTP